MAGGHKRITDAEDEDDDDAGRDNSSAHSGKAADQVVSSPSSSFSHSIYLYV